MCDVFDFIKGLKVIFKFILWGSDNLEINRFK